MKLRMTHILAIFNVESGFSFSTDCLYIWLESRRLNSQCGATLTLFLDFFSCCAIQESSFTQVCAGKGYQLTY